MRGFTAPKTETVVLTRGDESISFELQALPTGWDEALDHTMPKPKRFVNGRPADPTEEAVNLWRQRKAFLRLAKSLEHSGVLETKLPSESGASVLWEKAADSVREEMRGANLNDGDVLRLLKGLSAANQSEIDSSGN